MVPVGTAARSEPLSRREVDRRIASLRAFRLPVRSVRERLDRTLDRRIRVDAGAGWRKLVLVVGGEDVSWATVVDFRQRIGTGVLRMGGIAGVGTRDDRRFLGYSRCVLENALRWMRGEGYHASMLYGIPSYYPKFGYAKAFPKVRFTVAVRDAERVPDPALTLVPFAAETHLRPVLAMYHANNARRTGITLRDPGRWQPFRRGLQWGAEAEARVALDARGRAVGYIVYHQQPLTASVTEVGYASPAAFPALLRDAAQRAWEQRIDTVEFHLPEDDCFMSYCRGLGCRKEVTYPADGDGMVRLIHVPGALGAAAEDMASRARGTGCLTIRTNLDDAGLSWSGGRLRVGPASAAAPTVRLPQWALAQCLYGYREVAAATAEGIIRGTAGAPALLAELLPVRPHYHYNADHF